MPVELSVDAFNVACTKADGRDKIARFFQYAFRAFIGYSSMHHPKNGTRLHTYETMARTAMTNLGSARRCNRWCKEFPVIQNLPKSLAIKDPIDRFIDVVQKVSLATFMITDHVGHLRQWKILDGGKRSGAGTIQLALKFFCLSNSMGLIAQLKKYFQLRKSTEDKSADKYKCLETAFKHMLIILQTAHLSLLYPTHDIPVGIAGMISSLMDLKAQWPQKAVKA
eukprot:CAMPEP_0206452346 /NCGR_PEP_ID=MMETSP0324_2-20121206/19893_1 /ASSEMBLY_ACC=CAM_ASM_000836 /TAXON_ID=2866 /ORGANISM="Crypthecodinium cohnii, Strain Seligo" /LENGTH=223 /DNA_ID=CAMNT_0053922423 /DNA_START=151 /DNA_END=822 /DNA_ORIENTATION=-